MKRTQFQSVYVFFKQFHVLPKCSDKSEKQIVSCKVSLSILWRKFFSFPGLQTTYFRALCPVSLPARLCSPKVEFIKKAKSHERKMIYMNFVCYLIKPCRKHRQNEKKSAIYILTAFLVMLIWRPNSCLTRILHAVAQKHRPFILILACLEFK